MELAEDVWLHLFINHALHQALAVMYPLHNLQTITNAAAELETFGLQRDAA
jgi:hypothetical protein